MIFACLSLAVLLAACGGGNAPTQQPTGADSTTTRAGEPTTPVPTPHYTTTPATGAFAHLVPKGYEIVKAEAGEVITMGDLDGDTKPDAAILLQNMDEEMGKAAILIAYQQAENTFSLGEMTGDLGPEPLMSPDPSLLKIDKGVLTFHYQSMRWSIDLKFRKEAKYGDLRLIGSESENYGNAVHDGAGSASTNYLTGQRISNYMTWDEAKQDLVDLPEKREQVSKELRPLKGFNQDIIYDDL
jgi:hypothetical protein